MKVSDLRRKLAAALAAGGLLSPGAVYAAPVNTNLVVNPGFENVDAGTLGGAYATPRILSWSGTSAFAYGHVGSGALAPDYANGQPLASGGSYYFSADHADSDIVAAEQFFQNIDVTGGASGPLIAGGTAGFRLGGFFSGYLEQPDLGRLHVNFLNNVGASLGTAQVTSVDPSAWNEYAVNGTIPVGTTTARVSVLAAPGFAGGPSAYIDNVDFQVTTQLPVLSITINRNTGSITLVNQTGSAKNISGYAITSAFEALAPASWLSIADNYDSGNPGPNQVDPAHAWTEQTPPADHDDLTESDPSSAGASLPNGRNVNLGNAWIRTSHEDLTFQYTSGGLPVTGIVTYVGGVNNQPFAQGDVNTDGVINAADWAIVRTNQHANLSGQSLAEAYRLGDLTGDRKNNYADFAAFKSVYDAANGVGAFVAMAGAVPEPSTFVLVISGGMLLNRTRSRRTMSAKKT